MKKVIYLFYTKVYDFEYEKYGLNLMKERGLEVESWSLEKIFFPHVYRKNSSGIKDGIRFMEIHAGELRPRTINYQFLTLFNYERRPGHELHRLKA